MTYSLSVIISEFNGYPLSLRNNENGFREPTYTKANNVPRQALLGLLDPSLLDFYCGRKVVFNLFLKDGYIEIYEP